MKTPASILFASLMALGATSASAVNLPSGPCDGFTNCIQYSDFQVYSLPLLNALTNTSDYDVSSTSGAVKDFTVLGINNATNPNNPAADNGTLIDNAFNTDSANTTLTWSNMTSDTASGPGVGDTNGWDASVSALKTALGGQNLVGFFAFNETGQDAPNGSDLLIWVHVQLRDVDSLGNIVGTRDYYLQPTGSVKNPDPNFYSDTGELTDLAPWVEVHGGLCLNNDGSFNSFPGLGNVCTTGTYKDQANLGQNNAAFAVYSQDLDWQVKNGAWDILHIDWKMDYMNGGGETAWLMPFGVDNNVPEPGTLLLLGAALIGLSATKRVRKT